ncbi:MAG: 16S rRNA (adenine(1518)-N(6)/adenine(1519)-N(6))-dimethyltransferase, partial [Desulfomonilaceae bacterium]
RVIFPDIPPFRVRDSRLLTGLVKASFAGRRKTLRNTLRRNPIPGVEPQALAQAADDAGIDLGRRGETLSFEEFARFSDAIKAKGEN